MLNPGEMVIQLQIIGYDLAGENIQYLIALTNLGRIFKKAAFDNQAPWEQIAIPSA